MDEIQRERSWRGDGRDRPFDKFRYSKLVIHRIGDETYPKLDDGPGISSWFRLEPFDFYHRGIKFILGIESGLIANVDGYAGNCAGRSFRVTPRTIRNSSGASTFGI